LKNYLPLILGMMTVTYIPRLVPLITISRKPINPIVKRFLQYIPYSALSALVIRGILEATPDMRVATVSGICGAAICSYLKGGLILSVIIGIITAYLILQIHM